MIVAIAFTATETEYPAVDNAKRAKLSCVMSDLKAPEITMTMGSAMMRPA
jgi:hypothetical protein